MLPENLNKFLILLMWVENAEQQSVIGFGIVVGRIISLIEQIFSI